MPKHVPSFKHLLTSATSTRKPEKRERSVNELLASSRASASGSRDAPPHIPAGSSSVRGSRPASTPSFEASLGQMAIAPCGEPPIHPAEALRRAEIAQRQASRTTAGPVPPPSWRSSTSSAPKGESALAVPNAAGRKLVARQDLLEAQSLFESSRSRNPIESSVGPARLVEYCLRAVLYHLESEDQVYADCGCPAATSSDAHPASGEAPITIGQAMREQVGYLDIHLKVDLLKAASLVPEGAPSRLSDRSYRAILALPIEELEGESDPADTHNSQYASSTGSSAEEHDNWSDTSLTVPEIHHLALTIHANPLPFLRQLHTLPAVSLTSLNLAYSTVRDLEKLASELPASLRELGLAGIRMGDSNRKAIIAGAASDDDVWRRGLGVLGRRMIVLRLLDLSFPSIAPSDRALTALLFPAESKLPSLAVLGMRRANPEQAGRDLLGRINKSGRKRWIDVVL